MKAIALIVNAISLIVHNLFTGNNIYDEPSLPDPIYQELDVKPVTAEMIDNHSYNIAARFKLSECPAYAN